MTNYNKWAKFAADLASDSDAEEEQELAQYTKATARAILIPAGEWRPLTSKEALCKHLVEVTEDEFPLGDDKAVPWTMEDFRTKETQEKTATTPAEIFAAKRLNWRAPGSSTVPGYKHGGGVDKVWRLNYDDCFVESQTEHNKAARALLGTKALGAFIVTCQDYGTGKFREISRKEVADLIMARQDGKDADKIDQEAKDDMERVKLLKERGVDVVETGQK